MHLPCCHQPPTLSAPAGHDGLQNNPPDARFHLSRTNSGNYKNMCSRTKNRNLLSFFLPDVSSLSLQAESEYLFSFEDADAALLYKGLPPQNNDDGKRKRRRLEGLGITRATRARTFERVSESRQRASLCFCRGPGGRQSLPYVCLSRQRSPIIRSWGGSRDEAQACAPTRLTCGFSPEPTH